MSKIQPQTLTQPNNDYGVTADGIRYRIRTRPPAGLASVSQPQGQVTPPPSNDDAPVMPAIQNNQHSAAPSGDYNVGYAKPPAHTRFQKGRSGNPKGRPRGSINVRTAMVKALQGTVTVVENGRPIKMSRPEALAHRAFAQAIKGNARFFDILLQTGEQWEEKAEASRQRQAEAAKVDPRDQELIDLFLAQMGMKPDKVGEDGDGSAN